YFSHLHPSILFHHTSTTYIYTLSLTRRSSDLHDRFELAQVQAVDETQTDVQVLANRQEQAPEGAQVVNAGVDVGREHDLRGRLRSEEHTSELQSRFDLVCRLLLEKKKKKKQIL